MKPLPLGLGGLAFVALWVVLAFVLAIPSGWVHLPLAVGVVLIATSIIVTEPADRAPAPPTSGGKSHPGH